MAFNAIEAGRAFLKVFVDDKDVAPAFDRIQSKAGSFVSTFSRIAGPAAAVGTAFAAASAVAIKYASDAQETMSKFDVVFGSMSTSMKSFGDQLANELGRSKYAIAGSLASFQDLLVPMGMAPRAAAEMSKTLSTLAVDLGSFNNMADADVIRDLQAALTGSGEVMKKYGVIVSEAAVKQELLNMALDPKLVTEADKAQARLNIIMRGTTAAQGDAVRTADGYANQMKRLQDNAHDAAVELGNLLIPAATEVAKAAAEAAKNFGEWTAAMPGSITFLDDIAISATGAVGGIFELARAFDSLNGKLGTNLSLFTAISPSLDTLMTIGQLGDAGAIVKRAGKGPFKNTNPSAPFVNTPTNDGVAMIRASSAPNLNVPTVDKWQQFLSRSGVGGIDSPGKAGQSKLKRRLGGWLEIAGNAAGAMVPTIPGVDLSGVGTTAKEMVKGDFDWEGVAKEAGKQIGGAWKGVKDFFGGPNAEKTFSSTATFSAQAAALMGGGETVQQEMLKVEKQMLAELQIGNRKGGGLRANG